MNGYNSAMDRNAIEAEIYSLYQRKALALVGDVDPAFNLQPVIELVAKADAMGFDVVRRPQTVDGDR